MKSFGFVDDYVFRIGVCSREVVVTEDYSAKGRKPRMAWHSTGEELKRSAEVADVPAHRGRGGAVGLGWGRRSGGRLGVMAQLATRKYSFHPALIPAPEVF